MKAFTDIKEKAHQIAWETSKDYDPLLSKEAWCEMAALDMASWLEKQGEQKPIDNKERLGLLNFIRKETGCGLADANNALLKLIKVLKQRPLLIMDKPHKLKIEWEKQQGKND